MIGPRRCRRGTEKIQRLLVREIAAESTKVSAQSCVILQRKTTNFCLHQIGILEADSLKMLQLLTFWKCKPYCVTIMSASGGLVNCDIAPSASPFGAGEC